MSYYTKTKLTLDVKKYEKWTIDNTNCAYETNPLYSKSQDETPFLMHLFKPIYK